MALAALIWDVDGTLVDNEERHRQAFNDTFAAHGLPWHWDEACYAELLGITGGRERIALYARSYDRARADGAGFDAFVRRLHADKTRRYGELLAAGVTLRPGVARLIAEARAAGLSQAIATTTSRVNVERLLEQTLGPAALETFACVATGESVTHKKPAPDLYLAALDGLGLPPTACLAIEDTGLGLQAARAAGLATLITVSRYSGEDDFTGALAVVEALGEPDAPCRARAGTLHGKPCVDLDLMRLWHDQSIQNN